MIFVSALLATATPNAPIQLSDITAGNLAMECEKRGDLVLDPCAGFVFGVADTLSLNRQMCLSNLRSGNIQTLALVRKALRDRPEQYHLSAAWFVGDVLKKAFPCK